MTGARRIGQQLKFLADHNFNEQIVQAMRLGNSNTGVIVARDIGMQRAPDPEILRRAAEDGRIVLSHDIETMPGYAYERVAAGLPMPGLFLVRQAQPVGPVIEELLLLSASSLEGEWENRVEFISSP